MTSTKYETINTKQIRNKNTSNKKQYDLEERTFNFALECRKYCQNLPKSIQSIEDSKQLIRSSGSVAANYTEANESISKKDFILRVKIAKKEAKESILWLRLLGEEGKLLAEAQEIMNILGAILQKSI